MLVRIKLIVIIISIKTGRIDRGQKRSGVNNIANAKHHARLNLDVVIVQTVRMGEGNVIVLGAADIQMHRVFERTVVVAKGLSDQSVSGKILVGRQWNKSGRQSRYDFDDRTVCRWPSAARGPSSNG